jgi:hypothetical protein
LCHQQQQAIFDLTPRALITTQKCRLINGEYQKDIRNASQDLFRGHQENLMARPSQLELQLNAGSLRRLLSRIFSPFSLF